MRAAYVLIVSVASHQTVQRRTLAHHWALVVRRWGCSVWCPGNDCHSCRAGDRSACSLCAHALPLLVILPPMNSFLSTRKRNKFMLRAIRPWTVRDFDLPTAARTLSECKPCRLLRPHKGSALRRGCCRWGRIGLPGGRVGHAEKETPPPCHAFPGGPSADWVSAVSANLRIRASDGVLASSTLNRQRVGFP